MNPFLLFSNQIKKNETKNIKKENISFRDIIILYLVYYKRSIYPKWIHCIVSNKRLPFLYVYPDRVHFFFTFYKNHYDTQFKYLMDMTAVDYPFRERRFEIVYNILSIYYNARLSIKTLIDEISFLPTLSFIFSCANWWEREIWDMFGIFFKDHPDLRRILTDYGFEGYPLRKDFPLSGYTEVSFDDGEKRVRTETITIDQEYRYFDFSSPW